MEYLNRVISGEVELSNLSYDLLLQTYKELFSLYPKEEFPTEDELKYKMEDWFEGLDPYGNPWSVRSAMEYMIEEALNGVYDS